MTAAAPILYLVDDDASFLKSISRLLRASRFSVSAFDSAAKLLGHLSAASRGCIVADLNMPGLSGLDLQAELWACGRTALSKLKAGETLKTCLIPLRCG